MARSSQPMPTVQVDSSPGIAHATSVMDQRVVISKARARKRWVIRTGLLLVGTALLLFLLVTRQRDRITVETQLSQFSAPVSVLQAKYDTLKFLPKTVPELEKVHYLSDAERQYALSATIPVIVAVSRKVDLILSEDGRAVIIFENGKFRSEWMPVSDFHSAWTKQDRDFKAFEEEQFSKPPVIP